MWAGGSAEILSLPASVRIRPILERDGPDLVRLYQSVSAEVVRSTVRYARLAGHFGSLVPTLGHTSAGRRPLWNRPPMRSARSGHVAEEGGRIVGYALVDPEEGRRHPTLLRRRIAHAGHVFVDPSERSRGIGSALLASQLTLLASHGARFATMRIEPDEPAHVALMERGRFVPCYDRYLFAAPRSLLEERLARAIPGTVVSGEETLVPALVRRLLRMLRDKPGASHDWACHEAFVRLGAGPELTEEERTDLHLGLARRMLDHPERIAASHDAAHFCMLFDSQLFLSDQFPLDFAEGCLRRYVEQLPPGRDIVEFAVSPLDHYAQEFLRQAGLIRIGRDSDLLTGLQARRGPAD